VKKGDVPLKTKSTISAVIIIVLFCGFFSAVAAATSINIDGSIRNSEWSDVQSTVLFSSRDSSNCDLLTADYRYKIDYKDSAIFFAARCQTQSPVNGSLLFGAELIIDGDRIRTTADGVKTYNDYKYSCDSAFNHSDYGFQIEIRIGIKDDMLNKYSVELRLIDAAGSFSNKFDIVLWGRDEYTIKKTSELEKPTAKPEPKNPTAKPKPDETKPEIPVTCRHEQDKKCEPHSEITSTPKPAQIKPGVECSDTREASEKEKNNQGVSEVINLGKNDPSKRVTQITSQALNDNTPSNRNQKNISKNLFFYIVAALLIICAAAIIIGVNKSPKSE
jgi:hypothetical protein